MSDRAAQPGTPQSGSSEDWVAIGTAFSLPRAYWLQGALANEGVDAHIRNEELQGAFGEITPWKSGPTLLVRASQAAAAQAILARIEARADS